MVYEEGKGSIAWGNLEGGGGWGSPYVGPEPLDGAVGATLAIRLRAQLTMEKGQ